MFNFLKWREWLKEKASDLRNEGFVTEWKGNDRGLRGTSLSVVGKGRVGDFRNFENGLVDYEIMDSRTAGFIANESMIPVNDQNFVAVFQKFTAVLKKSS